MTGESPPGEEPAGEEPPDTATGSAAAVDTEPGAMRARAWTVAAAFREPADYDIPPLPAWTVYREAGGGMALGAEDGDGVFIAAEEPVTVRR